MVSFLFFFRIFASTIEKRRFFNKKYRALFFNGMTLCIIIALFMIIRKPCERVYSARLKSRLRYGEYDGKYFYNTERLDQGRDITTKRNLLIKHSLHFGHGLSFQSHGGSSIS